MDIKLLNHIQKHYNLLTPYCYRFISLFLFIETEGIFIYGPRPHVVQETGTLVDVL